jgi:hypothetical protein
MVWIFCVWRLPPKEPAVDYNIVILTSM